MSRDGGLGRRVLAGVSARSMRVVGGVVTVLAGGIVAASVGTDGGLETGTGSASIAGATTLGGDGSATAAVVAFALAHPAYPAAIAVGLVLLALGDDVALLGT